MARALKAAPSASLVLGTVMVLQRCSYCPVLSFMTPPPSSACHPPFSVAAHTQMAPAGTILNSKTDSSSNTPRRHPRVSHRTLRFTPASSPTGDTDSFGGSLIRGCVASLLCLTSLFVGPDVFRIHDEVASATGFSLRPPVAAALTDEQVQALFLCVQMMVGHVLCDDPFYNIWLQLHCCLSYSS